MSPRTRPPQPWQVWWTEFDPDPVGHEQGGRRPAIVVNSPFYAASRPRMSLVVPLTTRDRGLPFQPRLSITSPSGRPSVALVEQTRAVGHDRLVRPEAQSLTDDDVARVRFVLNRLIDLGG